jgi:hypothetical protein
MKSPCFHIARVALICASVALFYAHPASAQMTNTLTCSLQKVDAEYKGSCDVPCQVNALAVNFDGVKPKFTCSESARKVTASLRKLDKGDGWLGDMQGRQPEDPTRFEISNANVPNGGVAKTPFGWFRTQSVAIDRDMLTVSVAVDKQLPPTGDDAKILSRARELLANTKVWNKADDRNCPPNPKQWSLFCALMQATEEVAGGVHYRQPALQAAREVLNEVGGNRMGKHRLMDYNNHPDTTLEEVHQLLSTAQSRLAKNTRP